MKTFRKIIEFFNKFGKIIWIVMLIIKVVKLINDEVESKFGSEEEKVAVEDLNEPNLNNNQKEQS